MRRLLRLMARCGEAAMYVCGSVALLAVVRQIAFLFEFVTIGPLPLPFRGSSEGTAVYFAFEAVGLSARFSNAWPAAPLLVCSGIVLAWRLWRTRSARAGSMAVQVTISLAMLAWSYRFSGLVAALCVIGWQWRRPSLNWIRWVVWAFSVALCLSPYDVSCRNLVGSPHLETAILCAQKEHFMDYAENRKVCVGSDTDMYNAPIGVWVW